MPRFYTLALLQTDPKKQLSKSNHNLTTEAKCVFGKVAKYHGTLDGCFSAESVNLRTLSSVSAMWAGPRAQLPHGQTESLRDGQIGEKQMSTKSN